MEEFFIPTPDTSHLTTKNYQDVYEPSEDTFLMLDALSKDRKFLLENLKPQICLEIGVGSGCVITFLGMLLLSGETKKQNFSLFGTDINPKAAISAYQTAVRNNVAAEIILTNLVEGIESRLKGKVDVLIFNPPYVPSSDEDFNKSLSGNIDAAWAGGEHGRETLDKLMPKVKNLLSPKGCFYLVVFHENQPQHIIETMKKEGFTAEVVMKRRTLSELLFIVKFYRIK